MQQLCEQTHKVEIDNAPSWKHFEYVLQADSGVNAMLENALRYGLLVHLCLHYFDC